MAERELEMTINTAPPRYHPLAVSRIDDMSTLVFDHNIKRKHREARKKLRATSTIDRSDGLSRAAIYARATEAAPRYRASAIFLPPICGSAVHHSSMSRTIQQFIAPLCEGTALMHFYHLVGVLPQGRKRLGRACGSVPGRCEPSCHVRSRAAGRTCARALSRGRRCRSPRRWRRRHRAPR